MEELVDKKSISSSGRIDSAKRAEPIPLSAIDTTEEVRMSTGIKELDRVLGGGIVKGALMLVGGDPGIGKSTLLLQVCRNLAQASAYVL